MIATVLSCTATAGASTAVVQDGAVRYVADAGETNQVFVTVHSFDALEIRDPGAVIDVGPGCTSVSEHRARCHRGQFEEQLEVTLGDGDDRVVIDRFAELYNTALRGGAGDDVIVDDDTESGQ